MSLLLSLESQQKHFFKSITSFGATHIYATYIRKDSPLPNWLLTFESMNCFLGVNVHMKPLLGFWVVKFVLEDFAKKIRIFRESRQGICIVTCEDKRSPI